MGTSAVSFMGVRFSVMLLPLLLVSHSLAAQNQSGSRRVGEPSFDLQGIVHAAYDPSLLDRSR